MMHSIVTVFIARPVSLEYESEFDTEYEPYNSFQLDQSTCLSDDQFFRGKTS